MKKLGLCFLVLLFLCSCSAENGEMERALTLRSKILKAEQWSFDADITADYGDRLHRFSMECRADREGTVSFQVTAPESIAGISGIVDNEGGKLTFDDTALHFELLTDEQLSPVSGPWVFVNTLRSGCLTSACMEEGGIRLTADDSYKANPLMLDIWLDAQDLPSRCEVLYDGRRILTVAVKNLSIV